MRRMILGLCCLALAATPAWAQTTKDMILPVNHTSGGACNDTCCTPKICVAVPGGIKHTTTCFSSKCIDYCLPKCSLSRGCDTCAENCGHPRTKHVLMLKRVTHECGTTCVVALAPPASCAQPCCSTVGQRILHGNRGGAIGAPATTVETIPVHPMKK